MGTSSDTAAFAVEAIGSWWARYGCKRYRGADELLILADGGGSNGYRPRLWKTSLQERMADRYGLHVTVCHYPSGASKWNPVEHRLFGPVSINWAGQPLRSLEMLLGWVRGTEVGGVGVTASLDRATYPTKVKVSKTEMETTGLGEARGLPGLELHHQPTTKGTTELTRDKGNLEIVGWEDAPPKKNQSIGSFAVSRSRSHQGCGGVSTMSLGPYSCRRPSTSLRLRPRVEGISSCRRASGTGRRAIAIFLLVTLFGEACDSPRVTPRPAGSGATLRDTASR